MKVGGRLSQFSAEWAMSTSELAKMVRHGYEINFATIPPLTHPRNETILPKDELDVVRGEVANLLAKGAIEVVENPGLGFYSRMFVWPKPDKTWRSILNLKVSEIFIAKIKKINGNISALECLH